MDNDYFVLRNNFDSKNPSEKPTKLNQKKQ